MRIPMRQHPELAQSADKAAICLSFICALHCLLLPAAVLLLPSIAMLGIDDELFHRVFLIGVLPTSLFALLSGQRRHEDRSVFAIGLVGLAILITTALAGHELMGELAERAATVIGSSLVALSHYRNFKLCHVLTRRSSD